MSSDGLPFTLRIYGGTKMNYNKLLLDELRFVTYEKRNSELTDDLLVKAVTLNENL